MTRHNAEISNSYDIFRQLILPLDGGCLMKSRQCQVFAAEQEALRAIS